MNKPIFDPPIPYVDRIQGGYFKPQSLVRIQGTTLGIAYRFNINLQCGPTTSPQDDIAIQISVRMLDGFIVLNSLQNGIWGEEQVNSKMPIKRSERFEITISCDRNVYKVAINGSPYSEFPQRIHYDRISYLAIDGDVSIIQISYESVSQGSLPSASSPRSIAPIAIVNDDFEVLDNVGPQTGYQSRQPGFQPLPPGIHPASSAGFCDPPPYEETVHGKQFQPFPNSGAPYSKAGAPYPNSGTPYPISPAHPTPGSGYCSQPGSYQPPGQGPQGAYPLHFQPAPQVPLNAAGSNFRPVAKRNNTLKWCCTCLWTVVIIIILIVVVVVTKNRRVSNYSDTNYNSNSNYWSNN